MRKKCTKIEKLLYLYRRGELSDANMGKVEKHARACASCRAVLQQLQAQETLVKHWQQHTDAVHAPASIKTAVMQKLDHSGYVAPVRTGVFSRYITGQPRLQWVLLTVIVLLLGTMLLQETIVMTRVAALEQKMHSGPFNETRADYRRVASRLERMDVIQSSNMVNNDKDYILVNKQELMALLNNHHLLQDRYAELLTAIHKDPELGQLATKDTLRISDLATPKYRKLLQIVKSL